MTNVSFGFFTPKAIRAAFIINRTAQTLDTVATSGKLFVCDFQAHINCTVQDSNQIPQHLRAEKRACPKGIVTLSIVAQLHFYTMNQNKVMMLICKVIGKASQQSQRQLA